MPSTHSAAIVFFASYIVFACWSLPMHHTLLSIPVLRLAPLITTPWALNILASRVWLGHHTWAQVAAGAAYGFAWAVLWLVIWQDGVNEYGAMIENQLAPYLRWS
jgi:dolichyldiphosphatase